MKNSSPNSGYPEAAVSGALNIQLGGGAIYFGEKTEGQLIGAGQRGALPDDIKNANNLALTTTIIFFAALLLLYNLSAMI